MTDRRPNLLFVFGDQWRAQATGFVGNGQIKTPHLDAMAQRGVDYLLLNVGRSDSRAWEARLGEMFDRLLVREVKEHRPDVLLGYGGSPSERGRRRYVRQQGAAVIFALRNLAYLDRRAFHDVDAVLSTSRFITEHYRRVIGLESTPIVSPIAIEDAVADERDPQFLTFINPSLQKGAMVFARVAEELSKRHPTLPIMVIEARGTAGTLVGAGLAGGFDLRKRKNILVSPGGVRASHIYSVTRVLAVPSVFDEPLGRVPSEAILNGVPPIVSGRGGLPEAAAIVDDEGRAIDPPGGFIAPIPPEVTTATRTPVSAEQAAPWIDLCERLMLHDGAWAEASLNAERNAWRFHPDRLGDLHAEFIDSVKRKRGETAGPGFD